MPAASFAVTLAVSPSVTAGDTGISNSPRLFAVPEPINLPFSSRTSTFAPGSVLPVTTVPSAFKVALGASGLVVSFAVASVGSDSLPALSVTVTSTVSPLVNGSLSSTSKLPDESTVPVPMILPS